MEVRLISVFIAGRISLLAACYWKPSIDLRAEVRKARGLAELVDLLRVDECDAVVNAAAIALRNLAIDLACCWAKWYWRCVGKASAAFHHRSATVCRHSSS